MSKLPLLLCLLAIHWAPKIKIFTLRQIQQPKPFSNFKLKLVDILCWPELFQRVLRNPLPALHLFRLPLRKELCGISQSILYLWRLMVLVPRHPGCLQMRPVRFLRICLWLVSSLAVFRCFTVINVAPRGIGTSSSSLEPGLGERLLWESHPVSLFLTCLLFSPC
jgi:hypothetical protein